MTKKSGTPSKKQKTDGLDTNNEVVFTCKKTRQAYSKEQIQAMTESAVHAIASRQCTCRFFVPEENSLLDYGAVTVCDS